MGSRKRDNKRTGGSVIAVFRLLYDGKWHSAEELQDVCGRRFAARLYDLRSDAYGGWATEKTIGRRISSQDIPTAAQRSWWYRLSPSMLAERASQAALLAAGDNVFLVAARERKKKLDPFSERVKIDLTVADVVFLRALVLNRAELRDPDVKRSWGGFWATVGTKLLEALPSEFREIRDLMDAEDGR